VGIVWVADSFVATHATRALAHRCKVALHVDLAGRTIDLHMTGLGYVVGSPGAVLRASHKENGGCEANDQK
jgi:hypothetical protein